MKAELLYEEYRKTRADTVRNARIVHFPAESGTDTFNPSIPFDDRGAKKIAVRAAPRGVCRSEIRYYEITDKGYVPVTGPRLDLEDPFVTRIGGELVLGGVRLLFNPGEENSGNYIGWQTDFYRGESLRELRHFASGPINMKDIRLTELENGKIGVFTRPNGLKRCEGRMADIGFCEIDDLEKLNAETIDAAPLLKDFFDSKEWGGVNQAYDLGDGIIGAIGHIAYRDVTGLRHYYSAAFGYDRIKRRYGGLRIICDKSCFPSAAVKDAELADILFSAGCESIRGEWITLYTGISDTCTGTAEIKNPFPSIKKELSGKR